MRRRTQKTKAKKPMSPGKKKFLTALFALAFTGLMTCFIIGCYILTSAVSTVNGERIIDLEFYKENQDQTTIVYAMDKENKPVEIARLHGEQNRVWVELEDMSEWMGKAFIAIEDKRFEEHKGVDWFSMTLGIARSFVANDGQMRGASTITQQLIKNLTGEAGRNINRKYYEVLNALNLENYYDKDEILEAYLNTIYLSHNCYGVQTAAETYFGKDVSDLNLAECAAIAVITQMPADYDPLWQPEANKYRQEWCLGRMLEDGMITQEQYDEAVAYELVFTNSEKYVAEHEEKVESATDNEVQNYYVDYVISKVIKDLKEQGYSGYEANRMIYSGGLRIYSAVDMSIQSIVEDVYVHRRNFPSERVSNAADAAQSAMTIMDYNGRIVALVGGAGEKTENRSNNRAVSAVRQPGSSIKPLTIYAPAIEEDYITWSTKTMNYGITWKGKRWPDNYGGDPGSPNSYVTTQYAIAISYNTVPAQLLIKMGFDMSFDYVTEKFHISTLVEGADNITPSPLVTGGTNGGCTTLEMAAAFATFGNGGKYYEPYCYTKVTDSTGENILLQTDTSKYEQAISPETAYVMNEMMQTVIYGSMGTGRGYGVNGFKTFAKSGTTNNNNDRWMCAGTPYYVAAVWFGYDYNKEIRASGNPAGLIFKTVMDRVHKNLADKSFEKYTDDVVKLTYCTSSGLIADDGCASKATGWYKKSNIPAKCKNCSAQTELPEESTTLTDTPVTDDTTTTTAPVEDTTTTTAPPVVEEPSSNEEAAA